MGHTSHQDQLVISLMIFDYHHCRSKWPCTIGACQKKFGPGAPQSSQRPTTFSLAFKYLPVFLHDFKRMKAAHEKHIGPYLGGSKIQFQDCHWFLHVFGFATRFEHGSKLPTSWKASRKVICFWNEGEVDGLKDSDMDTQKKQSQAGILDVKPCFPTANVTCMKHKWEA